MKKYILFLILILVVVGDLFIANAVMVSNSSNKKFANSGYILKYTGDAERYYFGDDATYKESYNNQVVFKDTEDDKVVVDKNNFIHYSDGSISSFTKGALINLDEIETEPITYYNFSANKVLKRLSNNKYIAKNLDKELEFTNLIWKISDSKYLLAGTPLKIVFSDETEKEIEGYLEIEYTDNEIVKIYNQEVKYETISTDVFLQIGEDIKINLGTRIITKNDVNEMSLGNMVIDSNDNVNVVDLEEYKEDEEEEEESDNDNGANGGTTVQGGSSNSSSGSNIPIVGGNEGGTGDSTGTVGDGTETGTGTGTGDNIGTGDGNVEVEIESGTPILAPKYTVKEFKVSATGLQAIVEIEDEEARLTTGTTTSILNNATGKIVYTLPETGETQIKIDTASLEPNTEYTLVMEAAYAIDNVEYKKNFIYKVFRTSIFGVTLEKDLFTDESLSFNLKFDSDSTVSKLDVELVEAGQVREEIVNNNGSTEKIQFAELLSDTEYTVKIKNVYIGNTSNTNTYTYTFRTLKSIPTLDNGKTHGNVQVEIDKLNSQFVISIPELKDNVVETLNYQIFTETEGQEILVYNKITSDTKFTLNINETIQRNIDYYCRTFATFYDNEKVVEYEIANTETSFNMNSSEMPSIRFEKGANGAITFNSIKGSIVIEDVGNTINSKNAKVEIMYNSTTKNIDDKGVLTFQGIEEGLEIPIELKELKSNETYKLSVYATYDLHDGNGERYGYIGSIMITTREPIPMKAIWTKGEEGIDVSLKLESTEGSDTEALSLYSFDLALYLGQDGASNEPYATASLKDNGVESFAASLKTAYCDNSGKITQDIFGLTDAQVSELVEENKYCTIAIVDIQEGEKGYAKDYVSRNTTKNFENIIPIENYVYTYETAKLVVKNPAISENALKIEQVQKSRLETTSYDKAVGTKDYSSVADIISNNNINNTTTVAINVSANISNDLLQRYQYFEYFVYDVEGNLVAESGMIQKNVANNEVPKALFLISNGTDDETVDTGYIARGNIYHYAYYAYTDDTKQEKYPFDVGNYAYWSAYGKPRSFNKKTRCKCNNVSIKIYYNFFII